MCLQLKPIREDPEPIREDPEPIREDPEPIREDPEQHDCARCPKHRHVDALGNVRPGTGLSCLFPGSLKHLCGSSGATQACVKVGEKQGIKRAVSGILRGKTEKLSPNRGKALKPP